MTDADTEYDDYRDHEKERTRPWWVRLGLLGASTRWSARFNFWFAVLVVPGTAIGAVALGTRGFQFLPWIAFGSLSALAALWNYLCIRWVDLHGKWG